jgi:hypothetical protein
MFPFLVEQLFRFTVLSLCISTLLCLIQATGLEGAITEESEGVRFSRPKNNTYLSVILAAEIVACLYNNLCDNLIPRMAL